MTMVFRPMAKISRRGIGGASGCAPAMVERYVRLHKAWKPGIMPFLKAEE